MTAQNQHIGSSFDDFLHQEGIFEEVERTALKRTLAWLLTKSMQEQGISQAEMARRMKTSRTSVRRLLDPTNPSATIDTMEKAAAALGKRLCISLEDAGISCPA